MHCHYAEWSINTKHGKRPVVYSENLTKNLNAFCGHDAVWGPIQRSRCSNLLQAGRPRTGISEWARRFVFTTVLTTSGAHSASFTVSIWVLPGGKAGEAWCLLTTPLVPRFRSWGILLLYPCQPRRVTKWPWPLRLTKYTEILDVVRKVAMQDWKKLHDGELQDLYS